MSQLLPLSSKCFECDDMADGECSDCESYVCRNCFKMDHSHKENETTNIWSNGVKINE